MKKGFENYKRIGYIIGQSPLIEPCQECFLKVTCTAFCDERILWDNQKTSKFKRLKLKNGKRKKLKGEF